MPCASSSTSSTKSSARLVVKGKSMASEEIHLNDALEAQGIDVVETDLGEFIIQLAHETPSHIIVPGDPPQPIRRRRAVLAPDAGYPIAAGRRRRGGVRAAAAARRIPRRGRRHHRRQLRDRRDRLDLPRRERGQRAHVLVVAARPHRGDGHGAHRARLGRARRDAGPAGALGHRPGAVGLHQHHQRAAARRRARRTGRALRRRARQRAQQPDRHRVRGHARLHPLRRVPQRLPGLSPRRRSRLPLGVFGPDRRGAHPAVVTPRTKRPRAPSRVDPVRRLHRRVPGAHPVARPVLAFAAAHRGVRRAVSICGPRLWSNVGGLSAVGAALSGRVALRPVLPKVGWAKSVDAAIGKLPRGGGRP